MKRIILLLSLVFAFASLKAQETYRFRPDTPQGISIESSTEAGLSLHYAVNEIGIAEVENGALRGQEITLKGSFGSTAEGLPNLPFENYYIAVPQGAKVSIEVNEKASTVIDGIDLLPVAELQMNNAPGAPTVRKDMSVFGKDADFPVNNVGIAQSTRIRGLDVVLISVTPFRYNPVRKTLEVIYDIDIEVRFEGGNGQFGEARYRNPDWDHILRDLVINGDMLPEAHYYDLINRAGGKLDMGCEYLIIAPDDEDILAWADTLRRFRNRQGVVTRVVTTTECGGNYPEAIKAYIHNAYDNWIIPPAAVMIFGGMTDTLPMTYGGGYSGIPGFPLIFLKYDYENGTIQDFNYHSDNPYVDMNDDSIPDMAISRIAAFTLDEYQLQVRKLIDYETHPTVDPHYYDHPVITAGHEENKWFLVTSQLVDGFYRNKLGRHPTNLYMMYDEYLPRPDTVWSTGQNTYAVVDYFGPNGENYIAGDPSGLDHWVTKDDTELLADALNEESFMTLYRDHSASYFWCCPFFYSHHIHGLHNAAPTFILSIGCDAANYEHSFYIPHNAWQGRSVITEFCNDPVGALGGIGATTVTRSHYNDRITWGILDYIWPQFMPTLASSSEPAFVRPSYALVAGKLFLTQGAFMADWWPRYITDTHNVFHYLGDAYLNLYTEVPQHMDIAIAPYQTEDQREITFNVEEDAIVCIAREGEILQVAKGTGQPMTFALPEMQPRQRYQVTVTKQNRIRFQQDVTIIPSTGPYMVLESFNFHDEDNDGQLEYNETASIDLMLYNAGVGPAESTEIILSCESPYVEITQGSAICPHLSPDSHTTLYNALRVNIASDIPDQTLLTFKLLLDNGTTQQEIEFEQTVAAPILGISPGFRLFAEGDQPAIHLTDTVTYLTATVSNTGHAKSEPVDVKLNIKAPFVSVTQINDTLDGLEGGETRSFTFKINAMANEIKEAWLQTRIELQSGQNRLFLDTIVPYGGLYETFETDTLNPLFSWQNDTNYPWDYYSDDAAEGDRCFMITLPRNKAATLKISMNGRVLPHDATMSLYIKDEGFAQMSVIEQLPSGNETQTYGNTTGWTRIEPIFRAGCQMVTIGLRQHSMVSFEYKIDHLYFPPMHRAIAHAGDDMIACDESAIKLKSAYAYDCDAVLWTTDGDGHFDNDTIANPTYFPGSQDLANESVTLTLSAFGNDTIVSSTQIRFVDEINLGEIIGDSIVNKYEQHVSHYSVENQEGLSLLWELEPAEAGIIYHHGNEVDVLWNLHEGDAEVTLSVTAENGCSAEPKTKRISLIGYSTPEWHAADFGLFPNPTDGKVNLVIGETLQGKAAVEVYNLLGERMMAKNIHNLQKNETLSLDLGRLVSGLYIIKLSTNNGSCSKILSVR